MNGLLWEIIYCSVYRLEPYYQLSKPEGTLVAESLALDYSGDFILWVPIKAARYKHWAVCLSSTVYLLTSTVAAILTSMSWKIHWSEEVVVVRIIEAYARALQGVNAVSIFMAFTLVFLLWSRRSGLLADIGSIEDSARLIAFSPLLPPLREIPSYERSDSVSTMYGRNIPMERAQCRPNWSWLAIPPIQHLQRASVHRPHSLPGNAV
ncbi:hypothetical protein B0T17DRAFT_504066 [Bombardia bombarda]|uniref:Uncharacterized protein n=1 Tax=Bombardia bombarda TaxID=252184 RepID=A0AA40CFJ4_9PEZI|nr:hypothetical protein B0T17DRAFT_504066 [Bombardia bombarda]